MAKKHVAIHMELPDDSSTLLKWGKLLTRITAIGATLSGAFAAWFSTSSATSGIVLTAAGASTLAAAEKLPDQRYVKTKHIPPSLAVKSRKTTLPSDLLPKPEKVLPATKPGKAKPSAFTLGSGKQANVKKAEAAPPPKVYRKEHMTRQAASYERIKIND